MPWCSQHRQHTYFITGISFPCSFVTQLPSSWRFSTTLLSPDLALSNISYHAIHLQLSTWTPPCMPRGVTQRLSTSGGRTTFRSMQQKLRHHPPSASTLWNTWPSFSSAWLHHQHDVQHPVHAPLHRHCHIRCVDHQRWRNIFSREGLWAFTMLSHDQQPSDDQCGLQFMHNNDFTDFISWSPHHNNLMPRFIKLS